MRSAVFGEAPMSVRLRLRDCFRPLDYFLLGTLAGGFPIVFELGVDVSPDAGIIASLCLVVALLSRGSA